MYRLYVIDLSIITSLLFWRLLLKFHSPATTSIQSPCTSPLHCDVLSIAISATGCSPFSGSAGVRLSYFNGDPIGFCGDVVPVLGGVSRGIGEIVPLGGTGIFISSGDGGIISMGRPSIVIREASLL